jgi:hypothetical protein
MFQGNARKNVSTGYSAQKPSSRRRHETQSLGSDTALVPKHEYFDPCLQIGASLQRPLIDVTMSRSLPDFAIAPGLLLEQSRLVRFALALSAVKQTLNEVCGSK